MTPCTFPRLRRLDSAPRAARRRRPRAASLRQIFALRLRPQPVLREAGLTRKIRTIAHSGSRAVIRLQGWLRSQAIGGGENGTQAGLPPIKSPGPSAARIWCSEVPLSVLLEKAAHAPRRRRLPWHRAASAAENRGGKCNRRGLGHRVGRGCRRLHACGQGPRLGGAALGVEMAATDAADVGGVEDLRRGCGGSSSL
jgi:hypothetical protein